MKRYRNVAFLASLIILIPLLGCQKKGTDKPDSSIIVWHWLTDREIALTELAKRYKEKTGVDVQFQLYAPSESYAQKVRVGAQTSNLPEIFGILGELQDKAHFIEAGHIENLTEILGKGKGSWSDRFYKEALETAAFRPNNGFKVPEGIYGIPIDVSTIPMLYNRSLFSKAGLDPNVPPKTWPEFIAAGKKLKAAGFSGFVSGWAEAWFIFSMVTDLAYNQMGLQKMTDTFAGKVKYTDPDWVTVFNAFQDLAAAKVVDPSLVSFQNKSAEQAFSSERSGISFNGSWCVNVFAEMNPKLDYAPFLPPALNPKHPQTCWGGAGTIFFVNAKSPKKQMAIDFLKWLTEKEQAAYLMEKTKNLPAIKSLDTKSSPLLSAFAALMENSIHPSRFEKTEDPKVEEVISKGVQSILIGEKTGEEVAAEVQTKKEQISK